MHYYAYLRDTQEAYVESLQSQQLRRDETDESDTFLVGD